MSSMRCPDVDFAVSDDPSCAEALLEYGGADPNCVTSDGSTPLMLAATSGLTAVVQFLLRRDDVSLHSVREDGETAETIAEAEGHAHIALAINRVAKQRAIAAGLRVQPVRDA